MKSILLILASLCASFSVASAAPDNKDCPVKGKGVSKEVAYAKTVAFCCDKCKAKFDAAPKTFAAKIAAYKEADGKCPISGKPIDKTKTSDFKATIGVCCDNCKLKVEADPDKYLEKALK
jgi:YHS domain-containing protein